MQGTVAYDISPVRGPLANAFVILINALFFNVKLVGLNDIYPRDYSEALLKEDDLMFDFIIVGAGAAGCAVANRLTEHEMFTVLLIEAGDYPPPSTAVPGLYHTFSLSNEDWQFKLEDDPKGCQAIMDQRCTVSKGKVLGGTSSIDNMRYMRGLVYNYDKLGFPVISANVSFSIFNDIEGFERDVQDDLPFVYGTTGNIHLDYVNSSHYIKTLLMNSYRATGYSRIPRRKFLGFSDHLLYTGNGERHNMARSFLTPIKDRPNLFFTKNTEVEGLVLLEPKDKRINGVNVSISGIKFFIRARKEVILTAGPINNAKLMLVSGIGPKRYLDSKKITALADVPGVGKNLQFHLILPMYVSVEPIEDQAKDQYRELDLISDIFEYLMFRTGNLSHTGINNMVTNIFSQKSGGTVPDLAIYHQYFRIGDRNLMSWLETARYHNRITKTLLKINEEKAIIMFMVSLMQPLSRGELLLNDTHYLSNPKIYPRFMSDEEDLDYQTLLRGFNYITNLTQVYDMTKYNAEFLDVEIPNCKNYKFCTMAYVKCYIHNMAYPSSDVAGTAKLGEECEPDTVVKKDFELRHIRCLRVGDSSIMGEITAGSTVATDAMLGFNLGEILKKKWIKNYVSPYHAYLEDQEQQQKSKYKDMQPE